VGGDGRDSHINRHRSARGSDHSVGSRGSAVIAASRAEPSPPERRGRRQMAESVPPAAARSMSPAGAEAPASSTFPAPSSRIPFMAAELASATMRTVHTDAVLAAAAGTGAGTGAGSQRLSSPVRFAGSRLRSPPQSPLSPMFRHVSQALQAHAALTRNTAHASVFDSLTLDSLRRSGFPAAAAAAPASALRQPPASVASSVQRRPCDAPRAAASGWPADSQDAASQASRAGELPAIAAPLQPTAAARNASISGSASAAAPPATDRSSASRTAGAAASAGHPSQAAAVAATVSASFTAPPNPEHVITGSSRRWQAAAEYAVAALSSTSRLVSGFDSSNESSSRHGFDPQSGAAGRMGAASHGFQPPRGGFVSASTLAEKEAQVAKLLSRLTAAGALAAHG
jgi:hypothetical protein